MIRCTLCPNFCLLDAQSYGRCGTRKEVHQKNVSRSFGQITSLAFDPIEKKPLAFYHPGAKILSLGSWGCNLRCPFCQNHAIAASQVPMGRRFSPEKIHRLCLEARVQGNLGAAFTYNEPTICPEWVDALGSLIHASGLKNVLVTNGYTSPENSSRLLPLIDACNVDLKAFRESLYQELGGHLASVQSFIQEWAPHTHLEVTCLIVPGWNDSWQDMDAMSQWLATVDPDLPLHLTRFFPSHHLSHLPPTPLPTLYALQEIAQRSLRRVVLGNV
ncbi:putative radical SAM, Pyruvate-formate lyase-activating protein [Clostridiaceae bacterium JG1575]|nr:putative radical SAM, Pyruvate-formate lyase-activating protein [Clostridiaceae bacterium JG1575]